MREDIDAYQRLVRMYPSKFRQLPNAQLRIITDSNEMLAYSCAHQVLLGLHSETPYTYLLVDLVEREVEKDVEEETVRVRLHFPYQGYLNRKQLEGGVGVAILPLNTNPDIGPLGAFVLVEQFRHATGGIHLEIPRGDVNLV
jgi:hypothetical protein